MKPLPGVAYEKALRYIYDQACSVFDLYGDDFKRIGVSDLCPETPYEILVELNDNSCQILYEDDMKNFWEMRFEGSDGFYITYKIGETHYTAFYGKEIADTWGFEFKPGFGLYDPNQF